MNLNVSAAQAAQATLSWAAPTNYAGGATIPDFVGYNLYMGTSSGSYTKKVNIGDLTTYTVNNLTAGTTYYFALTAYDSMGNESGYSSEVNTGSTTSTSTPSTIYTISASAGAGGSISPTGSVAISQGSSQTFTITPTTGYKIAGVTVDGASVGAVASYTFSNVAANHTISASFSAATTSYSISATAGTGGSISPAGTTTVTSGGSQLYSITAASGYKVAGVTVDGASVGAVTSYTFSNVAANHTISATFSAATTSYSISATAGTGGSISPTGTTTVTSGGSQIYTITAASGYKIAGVTVDGTSVGAVNSYTFSNVTANHTISATFTAAVSANIAHTAWTLKYVDSQELVGQNGAATNAFDGKTTSIWHTKWYNVSPVPPCPHEIQINLGKSYTLTSFSYLPRQDGGINGTIAKYAFYVSSDGINWGTAVATGTWANNTQLKSVSFAAKTGQYIRLQALSEVNGGPWTSAAEINVSGY
ncbi:MAG TPA: discoidin domain-containing protein [Geomonas sp.]|nr:discoidin domain-containing protein [Geomonas sp.]